MNLHPIRWKWMQIAVEWIRFSWGFPAFWERADDVTSDRYAETSRDVFKLAKHFLFQQFECVVEVESTQVRVNPISNSNQVNQTMQKSSELSRRALMHSLSLRNWIKVDVIRVAVGDWFRFLQSSFQLEDLHSILAGILRDSLGIFGGYSGLIQPDSPPPLTGFSERSLWDSVGDVLWPRWLTRTCNSSRASNYDSFRSV